MTAGSRRFVRFGACLALAGVASCLAFWLVVSPAAIRLLGEWVPLAVFRVLNTPPSLLNLVLPFWLRSGLATNFTLEAPYTPWPWYPSNSVWQTLFGYLQEAIPANVLFLYGVTAAFQGLRKIRWQAHGA